MPDGSCGFVLEDGEARFVCSRETEDERSRCLWHSPASEKSAADITDAIDKDISPPPGSNLRDLQFEDFEFQDVDFEKADFDSSRFIDVDFRSCDLTEATFFDVTFSSVQLKDCALNGTRFGGDTHVKDSTFQGGDANEQFEMKSVRCEGTDFISFEVRDGSFYDTKFVAGECRQFTTRNSVLDLLESRRCEIVDCVFDSKNAKPVTFNGGRMLSTKITNRAPGSFRFYGLDETDVTLKGVGETDIETRNCSELDFESRLEDLAAIRITATDGDKLVIRDGNIEILEIDEVDLNRIEFDGTTIDECTLSGMEVRKSAYIDGTSFNGGNINDVKICTARFNETDFAVTSDKFHIDDAKFEGVTFKEGTHRDARFPNARISDGTYHSVHFVDGTHQKVNIDEGTSFWDTSFEEVNFERADFSEVDIGNTYFEKAKLLGCDLRDASLSEARLYDAHLANTRLNETTDFGDDCIYEREVNEKIKPQFDGLGYDVIDRPLIGFYQMVRLWNVVEIDEIDLEERLEKSIQVYSDYQRVLRENSIRDDIRRYRIRERDTRRKLALARGQRGRWGRLMLERWLMLYGEGMGNIIYSSALIILLWSFLYMYSGGLQVVEGGGPKMRIADSNILTHLIGGMVDLLPVPQDWIVIFARNLYFSAITFTTLGFGDIQPATQASRYLAATESFFGAVLMALLVYVLGRRATW